MPATGERPRRGPRARSRWAGVVLGAVVPTLAVAQIKASEPASVSQTVDGTRITVEYSRPRARGRSPLFGSVVRWDETWTPGANRATTLEVSKNVQVNGQTLPKGRYSVWLVVHQQRDWTVILDPNARRFHTNPPDSAAGQLRFDVHPDSGAHTEVLTWSFPEIRVDGTTLLMAWGTVRVGFALEVEPSYQLGTPSDRARGYVGTYLLRWTEAGDTGRPARVVVSYESGSLRARWDPSPFPEWDSFVLIPIADDWFVPGFLREGELYEISKEIVFEFARGSGRANRFTVRGEDDAVMGTGTRTR